jgi:hypothetical protein
MRTLVVPVLLGMLLLPAASAQFGSQTRNGDADVTATLAAATVAVNINEQDFGVSNQLSDNCLVLDTGTTAAAGAQRYDLHVIGCIDDGTGNTVFHAFDFVTDSPIDTGSAYPQTNGGTAEFVMYGDVNANNVYDANDTLYIKSSTASATGFTPGSTTGNWVVRLTPYAGQPAGAFVFPNSLDNVAFGASAKQLTTVSVGYVEHDNVTGLTAGDALYLMPIAAGSAAGTLVPLGSVRIGGTWTPAPPAPPPPTPEPTVDPTVEPTVEPTVDPVPPPEPTPEPTPSPTSSAHRTPAEVKTPGLELVVVVGAVALLAIRRRA